mmetsp:Transcript_94695/g.173489  ORF Transcript_94695/g.173489 Transcript_94695/m.173489 type:complete len:99 (+) Transcript_94695:123-419(+)
MISCNVSVLPISRMLRMWFFQGQQYMSPVEYTARVKTMYMICPCGSLDGNDDAKANNACLSRKALPHHQMSGRNRYSKKRKRIKNLRFLRSPLSAAAI